MSMLPATWTPDGFDRYRGLYPQTPSLAPEPDRVWTKQFARVWREGNAGAGDKLRSRSARTTIVFVRGYLGHYMPGNLLAAHAAVRRLGFDAFIARNRAGGTVATNVAALAHQLAVRGTRKRLVFCGHSRGGLECMTLLASEPELAARCDGVALSQTPHGSSRVIESVLLGRHHETPRRAGRRVAEVMQHAALVLLAARRGGYELTSDVWPALVGRVEGVAWPFPVLQTASWSSRPTAWLDSFHKRLGEISPGHAHDGQFFLNDLIWPRLPHLLLPDLDHAQPAVGGYGFDHARYWLAVLAVLLQDRPPQSPSRGKGSV